MNSIETIDEVVKEYLIFRGFFPTLRAYENDIRNDKDKGFQVDRVIEQLVASVTAYDLAGLLEFWGYLDLRFFSRLEDSFFRSVKRFELCLLRYYLVNAAQHGRKDKIIEFFDTCGNDINEVPEWQNWFALAFLKKPETDSYFETFFSKAWLETFLVSFQNFLQTVFHHMPLPTILSFNLERLRIRSMETEIESLRRMVENLKSELKLMAAEESEKFPDSTPSQLRAISRSSSPTQKPSPRRRFVSDEQGDLALKLKPLTSSRNSVDDFLVVPSTTSNSSSENIAALADDINSGNGSFFRLLSQDVFTEHEAPIVHCRFSVTGSLVASMDSDRYVRLWSPHGANASGASGAPSSIPSIFKAQLPSMATALEWDSKSDRLLFLGTENATMRVFNADGKIFVHDFVPENVQPIVCALLCNPVDPLVVASYAQMTSPSAASSFSRRRLSSSKSSVTTAVSKEGSLLGWSLRPFSQKPVFAMTLPSAIRSISFNHNGQLMAAGDADGTVRILDMRTLSTVASWASHDCDVIGVAFSFDETVVYSIGTDSKVVQWSLRTPHVRIAESPPLVDMATLTSSTSAILASTPSVSGIPSLVEPRVVFSQDGTFVLSTFSRPQTAIYETKNGKEVQSLGGHSAPAIAIDWSAPLSACLTGSVDKTVRVSKLAPP